MRGVEKKEWKTKTEHFSRTFNCLTELKPLIHDSQLNGLNKICFINFVRKHFYGKTHT